MKLARLPVSLREGLRCACSPRPISRPIVQQTLLDAGARTFSTSIRLRAETIPQEEITSAPPISFSHRFPLKRASKEPQGKKDENEEEEEPIFYARLVPASPSYFTAQPHFTDDLLLLRSLAYKHAALPIVKPGDAPRVAWGNHVDYKNVAGETIKAARYHKIVAVLARLNQIHPALMPAEVEEVLRRYRREINPFDSVVKAPFVDEAGQSTGAGRRKSSSASATIMEGTGEIYVNGKTLAEKFGRYHDRESAIWALKATDRIDKYNVWAHVEGGGTTGQAEALTLAIAKALMGQEPLLKPALRRGKLVLLIFEVHMLTIFQLDVSPAIQGESRERSLVMSRRGRCLHGSRDRKMYTTTVRPLCTNKYLSHRAIMPPFSDFIPNRLRSATLHKQAVGSYRRGQPWKAKITPSEAVLNILIWGHLNDTMTPGKLPSGFSLKRLIGSSQLSAINVTNAATRCTLLVRCRRMLPILLSFNFWLPRDILQPHCNVQLLLHCSTLLLNLLLAYFL